MDKKWETCGGIDCTQCGMYGSNRYVVCAKLREEAERELATERAENERLRRIIREAGMHIDSEGKLKHNKPWTEEEMFGKPSSGGKVINTKEACELAKRSAEEYEQRHEEYIREERRREDAFENAPAAETPEDLPVAKRCIHYGRCLREPCNEKCIAFHSKNDEIPTNASPAGAKSVAGGADDARGSSPASDANPAGDKTERYCPECKWEVSIVGHDDGCTRRGLKPGLYWVKVKSATRPDLLEKHNMPLYFSVIWKWMENSYWCSLSDPWVFMTTEQFAKLGYLLGPRIEEPGDEEFKEIR